MSAVAFSGYIIEQGDLRPDPAKVKAVVEWPESPNQCQLQRFFGFANFYRWFIQDFSMVTLPDKQGGPCFSTRFHFSITYKPGSCNVKPDDLSQQFSTSEDKAEPAPILPATCIMGAISWEIESAIQETQRLEPDPGGGSGSSISLHRRRALRATTNALQTTTGPLPLTALWDRRYGCPRILIPSVKLNPTFIGPFEISALVNMVFCKTQIATQHENARFPCVPD